MNKAIFYDSSKNCGKAISYYNFASSYYGFMYYSQGNKERFLEIPYRKALCYLSDNSKEESLMAILKGSESVEKKYGVYSSENADYIRMYLIPYYLQVSKLSLAQKEFEKLLKIYLSIGYKRSELADMVRIKGDLCYFQGNHELAKEYYKKSYDIIFQTRNIDYYVLEKLSEKMANAQVDDGNIDAAIEIHQKTLKFISESTKRKNAQTVQILLQLGDLYLKKENPTEAANYYQQAIDIIKTLPSSNYYSQNIIFYLKTLKELYDKTNQVTKSDAVEVELNKKQRFKLGK